MFYLHSPKINNNLWFSCDCSSGMYLNGTICTRCDIGSYKDGFGGQCIACPGNQTTEFRGSNSASACGCPPGQYFDTSSNGCTLCDLRSYKSKLGPESCTSCPGNKQTCSVGSTLATDCACPQGQFWNATANLCGCPAGIFVDPTTKALLYCPDGYNNQV